MYLIVVVIVVVVVTASLIGRTRNLVTSFDWARRFQRVDYYKSKFSRPKVQKMFLDENKEKYS
jgi:hypothetical protein